MKQAIREQRARAKESEASVAQVNAQAIAGRIIDQVDPGPVRISATTPYLGGCYVSPWRDCDRVDTEDLRCQGGGKEDRCQTCALAPVRWGYWDGNYV